MYTARRCLYTKVYKVSIYIYAAYPQGADAMMELTVSAKGIEASKLARKLLVNLCTKRVEGKGVIIILNVLLELSAPTRVLLLISVVIS